MRAITSARSVERNCDVSTDSSSSRWNVSSSAASRGAYSAIIGARSPGSRVADGPTASRTGASACCICAMRGTSAFQALVQRAERGAVCLCPGPDRRWSRRPAALPSDSSREIVRSRHAGIDDPDAGLDRKHSAQSHSPCDRCSRNAARIRPMNSTAAVMAVKRTVFSRIGMQWGAEVTLDTNTMATAIPLLEKLAARRRGEITPAADRRRSAHEHAE